MAPSGACATPPSLMPRLSSYLVTRPRLFTKLDEGNPLTLLRAPVGFGKTTLVAQWLQARPDQRAAWITVDQDASDAAGFWRTVLDALIDIGLDVPPPELTRSFRSQARQAISRAGEHVVLVIDAFDRVTAEGLDVALLELLRTSQNVRLVVCLRSQRYFRPNQYLDLDFTVIPADELFFTVDETSALLHEVGVELSDDGIRAVHADTGGWTEPTRALAIALRQPSTTSPSRSTDHQAITEVAATYVRERILPAVDQTLVAFALATSLVDRLSHELAHVLTDEMSPGEVAAGEVAAGEQGTEMQLQQLEADGLLQATVEDGGFIYRWPPAARRCMLAELHRRFPERVPGLHARIARWYQSKDQPEPALCHALSAEDWPLAIQIIERDWRQLLVSHRDVIFAAFSAVPLELIEASPRALAVRDLRLLGPDDRVLALLAQLPTDPGALRELGDAPQAADIIDTGLALVLALRRRGLFRQAHDYTEHLETVATTAMVKRTRQVATILPGFWFQVGVTRLLADRLAQAQGPLQTAYETASDGRLSYVRSDAPAKLALLHAVVGNTTEAAVWLRRYDEAPQEKGWFRRMITSTAVSAQTLVALERLELDRAARLSATTAAEIGTDEFWAFAAYTRALLALHTGDTLGGLHRLDQARAASPRWYDDGSTARPLLASVEADLLLSLGRANQARIVLVAAGRHPYLQVTSARLELLAGDPEAALGLATDLNWARRAERRPQLEMLLIQAIAHHRLQQPEPAADALRRALATAQTTQALRPFATVPLDDLTVIAERLPTEASAALRNPLLRLGPKAFPERVEYVRLTRREQVTLEKIAEGLLVRQIANDLYVSVGTVKTHLRSIYQKLSANSRQEAVTRGRQLGFVADPQVKKL